MQLYDCNNLPCLFSKKKESHAIILRGWGWGWDPQDEESEDIPEG